MDYGSLCIKGGGVYATDWGDIYIGGKIVVNNNTNTSGSGKNNFYLEDDSTFLNHAAAQTTAVPDKPFTEGAYIGLYSNTVDFCISDTNSKFVENSIKYLHSDLPTKVIRSKYMKNFGNHSYQFFYESISSNNIPTIMYVQSNNQYVISASCNDNSRTINVILDTAYKKNYAFNNIALNELIRVTYNKEGAELAGFYDIRNFAVPQEYKLTGADGTYSFWTVTIEWLCTAHEDQNGDYACDKCGEYALSGATVSGYNAQTQKATVFTTEAGKYTLVFADYENGILENVDIVEYEFKEGFNFVEQENKAFSLGTDDKVMLWYDMTSIIPVCKALPIE